MLHMPHKSSWFFFLNVEMWNGVDHQRLDGRSQSGNNPRFLEKGIRTKILPFGPLDRPHGDSGLLKIRFLFQLDKDALDQVRRDIKFPSLAVAEFQQQTVVRFGCDFCNAWIHFISVVRF